METPQPTNNPPSQVVLPNNVSNNVTGISNNIGSNHNNNTKTDNIKSGVSLDACKLAKQSMPQNSVPQKKPYINISTGDSDPVTGNGVIQNGPYTQPSALYINNTSSRINDSEISC